MHIEFLKRNLLRHTHRNIITVGGRGELNYPRSHCTSQYLLAAACRVLGELGQLYTEHHHGKLPSPSER